MAVRFDASGDRYTATNGAVVGNISATCWIYLVTNRLNWQTALSFQNASSSASNWLDIAGNTTGQLGLYTTNGDNVLTGLVPTLNTWYRVGISVTGSVGTIYWGISTGGLSSATGDITNGTKNNFFIGSNSYSEWWNGRVAAVKVWNAALTSGEIATELASYTAVRTSNLVRVHSLTVPSTTDESGNGNTLSGGTGTTTEADPPITVNANAAAVAATLTVTSNNITATASGNATPTEAAITVTSNTATAISTGGGVNVDPQTATLTIAAADATSQVLQFNPRIVYVSTEAATRYARHRYTVTQPAFVGASPPEPVAPIEDPMVRTFVHTRNANDRAAYMYRRPGRGTVQSSPHGVNIPLTELSGGGMFFGGA